ncbi:hypothetical protein V6N13_110985 [Hibiscus sabdariffa]
MSDQLGERFGNMLGSYIELDVREGDGRWVIFYRFEFLSTLVGHCGNALTLVELWMGNRGRLLEQCENKPADVQTMG